MREDGLVQGTTDLLTTGGDAAEQAALWALLSRQAARYTMGDSSSLPVETARELLASIRFCVGLCREREPAAAVDDAFTRGREMARAQLREAAALAAAVRATPPPVASLAYRDTLAELELFPRRYDADYRAHDIPCMIDYPLSRPVEGREGVAFIVAYLRRLQAENEFCRRFAPGDSEALLRGCSPAWREDLLNLYETAAHCALALTLLERDFGRLAVSEADRAALRTLLSSLSPGELDVRLRTAAEQLCDALDIHSPYARAYHRDTAASLGRRIRALPAALPLVLLLPSPAPEDAAPPTAVFRDGARMEDGDLRALVEEINGCRFAADKVAAVRRHVHSLGDLLEILDTCFWEEESRRLFAVMGDAELAALGHALDERRRGEPDRRSPSGWEDRFEAHLADLDEGRRERIAALREELGKV